MTVEEMRTRVNEECVGKYCGDCPLYHHNCQRIDDDNCTLEEAIGIYNLMFPQDRQVEPTYNPVSHPSHYTQGGIECIQAMEAAYGKETTAHFCICNAFKYLWRTEHKNGKEDIDKAIWYLTKYKELKYNE